RLKHTFTKTYAGLDNSHKAMLLEDGITYKPLTMNMDEVQLLEARKHSAADMGRIHGVPLHMIQELDKATYSNITEQAQSFIKDTIQPITRAWVQELELKLVNATEVGQVQLVFDAKEYLRGDPKTSAQYYKDGMSAGWITGNEIREMEGLKPIEGLEKPFVPMNMRPIDQPVETSKTVRAVWSMARNRLENFEKRILNSAKPKTFEDYKRFVERELIDMQDAIAFVSRQTARDIAHLSDSYIQKRFMKFETLSDNKNIRDLPDLVNALEGLESKESSNV
ncbi:MAG: phage portal protein, partial [Alphaproteobacteria bacterium]|nr:phage portal protein [Alphaproteobacteria bacterium]